MGNCCKKSKIYFFDINNDADVIYANNLVKELHATNDNAIICNKYEELIYKLNTEYNQLYFEDYRTRQNKKYVIDRINLIKYDLVKKNMYHYRYIDDKVIVSYDVLFSSF